MSRYLDAVSFKRNSIVERLLYISTLTWVHSNSYIRKAQFCVFKKRDYSKFRQFSERFLTEYHTHAKTIKIGLLQKSFRQRPINMVKTEQKFARRPFFKVNKGQNVVTGFVEVEAVILELQFWV